MHRKSNKCSNLITNLQMKFQGVTGIHNEFETTIKRVGSDNGSEFKNTRIDELCDKFGIRHQFSAKYTP